MGAFEDYAAAARAFKAAHAEVSKYQSVLQQVADALASDRSRFIFLNAPGEFPPEASMGRDCVLVHAADFPTATAINAAIQRWHECRETLLSVWHSLPKEQKEVLPPPPEEAMINAGAR
jgi:hypothetical protein